MEESAPDDRVRVIIRATTADALRTLVRDEDLDLNCGGPRRAGDRWSIEAFVSSRDADRVSARVGYEVEIDRQLAHRAAARRAEVGSGDRYEGGLRAPPGLGHKG